MQGGPVPLILNNSDFCRNYHVIGDFVAPSTDQHLGSGDEIAFFFAQGRIVSQNHSGVNHSSGVLPSK